MNETEKKIHEKFAKELFNRVWDFMDKKNRTIEEDIEMIHATHASCHHWGQIGKSINFQWSEWQISRVYAVLK